MSQDNIFWTERHHEEIQQQQMSLRIVVCVQLPSQYAKALQLNTVCITTDEVLRSLIPLTVNNVFAW